MATNYVTFGDSGTFELNSAGWNLGATGVRSTAKPHSGSYSIKMTGLNDQCYCQGAYPYANFFVSGKTATFSAWVWCDTPNSARLRIGFRTQTAGHYSYSRFHSGNSTWERLTVKCDALPEETNPWLAVRTELACNCYFDDVTLEAGSTVGEKELKTNWPFITGLDAGVTSQTGRTENLVAEQGSNVSKKDRVGIK